MATKTHKKLVVATNMEWTESEAKGFWPAKPIEGRTPTAIEWIEWADGKLILQGAEDGVENVRDGLGWTVAISEETGKFVFTAPGEEVAFVVFGACIAQ